MTHCVVIADLSGQLFTKIGLKIRLICFINLALIPSQTVFLKLILQLVIQCQLLVKNNRVVLDADGDCDNSHIITNRHNASS